MREQGCSRYLGEDEVCHKRSHFVDLRFFVVNRALCFSLPNRRLTGDGSPYLGEGSVARTGDGLLLSSQERGMNSMRDLTRANLRESLREGGFIGAMGTKLTLVIEPQVIRTAKQYARRHNKSVSKMVEQYLALVSASDDLDERVPFPLGQLTSELIGSIRIADPDAEEKSSKQLIEEAKLSRFE